MRVKIPAKRIIIMWLAVFFIAAIAIFLFFFQLFMSPWDARQIVLISIYVITMGIILFFSIKTQYYELNKKDLTESKFGKKYTYFYSDIIYIDDEQSLKSRVLTFVTKEGRVKYLNFDKEGMIYKVMKSKCQNLITFDELKKKFPNIKV